MIGVYTLTGLPDWILGWTTILTYFWFLQMMHWFNWWEYVYSGMDYWNGGMEIFKVYYEFLHLNIPQLAYLDILSILHLIIRPNLIQVTCVIYLKSALSTMPTYLSLENFLNDYMVNILIINSVHTEITFRLVPTGLICIYTYWYMMTRCITV